jgi:beta-ketoacyl-acyl-carrier-protein synthase II
MQQRRVAVTGLGAICPIGNNISQMWENLLAGQCGIAEIKQFDASAFPTRIAAEVKNFVPSYPNAQKLQRTLMGFTSFAMEAAHQAFQDSGFTVENPYRFGIVAGCGMMTAEFEYLQRFQQVVANNDEGEVDWQKLQDTKQDFYQQADFAKTTSNAGLSALIQAFGSKGYANAVHTACASSGQALGLALQAIRRGEADQILAGGFDSMIHPLGLSSFCLLGALSKDNDDPENASRPFDGTRQGFVLGEGAAFLMLEEWDSAVARGAEIYAELAGEGNSLSAYRITDSHPNGDGAIQAIQQALADAGVVPHDVDYINAHGTSTKMNDLSETNAIKAVFEEKAYQIPVSSTKAQTGHLIAAAGALEAVITVKAIQEGIAPMTAHLKTPDPDCDLDYVTEGPREKAIGVAVSNSFGFGGSNSSLVFKHPHWRKR